jgi:hypothetical protein
MQSRRASSMSWSSSPAHRFLRAEFGSLGAYSADGRQVQSGHFRPLDDDHQMD